MQHDDDDIKDDIIKESNYESAFEFLPKETLYKLFEFYLYKIANSSDSPLSLQIDKKLNNIQKNNFLQKIFDECDIKRENFISEVFLKNNIKDIHDLGLSDKNFVCDKIKGFIQTPKNTEFIDSLFKRIRDSFAHGRIARSPDNKYLILEDKTNQLTGRIVINTDILLKWILIITKYIEDLKEK